MVGKTNEIYKLKEKCGKFAAAGVPMILITGERGTGKEVFARHIHQRMHPPESGAFAPFLGINCAALPEQLIESELFGHEKGAFTDAKVEKKGIFEAAHDGSILLAEIGEMRLHPPGNRPPGVGGLLVAYRWPGNIRELRNVIERIVVLENDEIVRPEHLPAEILHLKERAAAKAGPGLTIPDTGLSLEEVEKNLIVQALEKAGQNKTQAAKLLGITYDSLRYQAKKFGLE